MYLRSRFSRFALAVGMAALALTGLGGCNERPPRSFVQPNVIKKSDLNGTWYYLQTVTQAPVTSSFIFNGNSSELMKVKFDVQEGVLFARRSYEQIKGSEDAYRQNPEKYLGQPLAAWRIQSQFDIIRDYNPTTGEETNRIIESMERPWNEREFIRVDWSQNMLGEDDLAGIGINFFFEPGVRVKPASYWESDPTKPDAFRLERATEADAAEFELGEANYFDLTNKWVLSPGETTLSWEEGGQRQAFTVPTCLLSYQTEDCASQVVKVRHAFAKISPKHDYQPRDWDGRQMEMFGVWDVGLNRLTYNRQYGVTNSGFDRHAARFNIWKKSCTSVPCKDDRSNRIPYEQREIRTTPYYAESSLEPFPVDLFDLGGEVVRQWNEAAKVAAGDVMKKDPATLPDVFVWCHNPVKLADDSMGPKDPDACVGTLKPELDAAGNVIKDGNGNPIYRARQGDPRRSTLFWVNEQQNSGPLGYGPPMFDIETGETISGQAYVYGGAIDSYAARSRDLVDLLLGRLSAADFAAGTNVKDFVSVFRDGAKSRSSTTSSAEVERVFKSMDLSWSKGLAPQAKVDGSSPARLAQSLRAREDAIYQGGIFGSANANLGQIRRDRLRGTQLEAMTVTPDVMATAGNAGGDWTSLSNEEKLRVSPLRSQAVQRAVEERMEKMRVFGYEFAEFADEGMVQRAINLSRDPSIPAQDSEAIRQRLRRDIYLAVTLHEMGHNVGMRHNFRASWDAMNYPEEYWKLRVEWANNPNAKRYTGISVDPNTGVATATGVPFGNGAECNLTPVIGSDKSKLKARYLDCQGGATSTGEIEGILPDGTKLRGGVREFQSSSIMDYGAEFNSDFMGLGKYDKAAMKFAYAGDGFVEVFTKAKTADQRWGWLIYFQGAFGFPSPIFIQQSGQLQSINYTSYPDLFQNGDYKNIQARKDVPFEETTYSLNSNLIRFWDDPDGVPVPVVPYYFCSDEFAGNLTCLRFDSGADAYEQAADVASRYENYYIMNNFKRDRFSFYTSLAYKGRIAGRYFQPLRNQMTWFSLLGADFATDFSNFDQFMKDPNGWGNFTLGVKTGLDILGRTVTRPEAGTYQSVDRSLSPDYDLTYWRKTGDDTAGNLLQPDPSKKFIGLIDGKYINTTWDFDGCGYYWGDECQTRIGYFIDKTVALEMLTDSQAYFTGRDTTTDVRKYAIGYITSFKSQLLEKFGAIMSGDYTSYAPRAVSEGAGSVLNLALKSWTTDQFETLTGPVTTPPVSGLIDPATGFTTQLYAGLYALSSLPTTFDQTVIDSSRIFLVGNGEAPVTDTKLLADGVSLIDSNGAFVSGASRGAGGTAEWVYVLDTETGKTYAAHSTAPVTDGAGVTRRTDMASRMLETYAQLVAARTAACTATTPNPTACTVKGNAVRLYKQNLDVMRSLHGAMGYGVYRSDAPFMY